MTPQASALRSEQIEQAAQHIYNARKTRTPGPLLPESYRPADAESAIAIQRRVLELLGEPFGGWKCGVPSARTGVIVSPLPASCVIRSSHCAVPGTIGLVEPEIAVVLSHDLPARETPYTIEEMRAAIGETRFVIELIASRYADRLSASREEMLADSYSHHALLVGPRLPEDLLDRSLESVHIKVSTPDHVLFDREGRHPSGHPLSALAWLSEFLHKRGEGMVAGQVITTGSYAGIVEAPVNTPIHVELGNFGVFDFELITEES